MDPVYSFARPAVYVILMVYARSYLLATGIQESTTSKSATTPEDEQLVLPWTARYATWLSLLGGFTLFLFLRHFFTYVLGLSPLGAFDHVSLFDFAKNKLNIIGVLYIEGIADEEKVLAHLEKKMMFYKKLRSRFVKVFDTYYLQEVPAKELEVQLQDIYVRLPAGTLKT